MPKLTVTVILISLFTVPAIAADTEYRQLPVAEYVDKMKAGWIGQMAGVGWGVPTEFKWTSAIIPVHVTPPKKTLTWQGDFDKITNVDWVKLCSKAFVMVILATIMREDCCEA